METVTEKTIEIDGIVEAIVEKINHDAIDPAEVEKVVVSQRLWSGVLIFGGQIVHVRQPDMKQFWLGDYKVEPGDIETDFEIVRKDK